MFKTNRTRTAAAAVLAGGLMAGTVAVAHAAADTFVPPRQADATVTLNPDTFQQLRLELSMDSGDVIAVEGRRLQIQDLAETVQAQVAAPRTDPLVELGTVTVAARHVSWVSVVPAR